MLDSTPPSSRFKRRARFFLLTSAVLLIVGGIIVNRFVLNLDRYRPEVISELAKTTGLPVELARLNLDIFPSPRITLSGFVLGEGDFRISVDSAEADVDLMALARGVVSIQSAKLRGVALNIPAEIEALEEKFNALIDSIDSADSEGGFEFELHHLYTSDARLFRGAQEEPFLTFSTDLSGVTSGDVTAAFEAALSKYGDEATLHVDFTLKRIESGAFGAIAGTGKLTGLEVAKLPIEGSPEATLDLSFKAQGDDIHLFGVALEGALDSEEAEALAGNFSAQARWDYGELTVNDFEWNAPGVQFTASLTRSDDGAVACTIASATLEDNAVRDVVAMANFGDFHLESRSGARFEAKNLSIGMSPEGAPRLSEGKVQFRGINVMRNDGSAVTRRVHGKIAIEEGVVRIRELSGQGITLAGTLTPDFESKTVALDLSGSLELTPALLALFVPNETVRDAEGTLTFERIAGTFAADQGVPEDLVIEGYLENGKLAFATDDFEDEFDTIAAQFTTDKSGIDTRIQGASPKLGAVRLSGRYTFENRTWTGSVFGNVSEIAKEFIRDPDDRDFLEPMLDQYGHSTFRITAVLPSSDDSQVALEITRMGIPSLVATVTFAKNAEGSYALGDVEATTGLQIDPIAPSLPDGLDVKGRGAFTFYRNAREQTFEARCDLTYASVHGGEYLHKRIGDTLILNFSGTAADSEWEVTDLSVQCLGVPLGFTFEGDRIRSRGLEVDLAQLARLFPEGSSAKGLITGSIVTNPIEARLLFDDAGLGLDETNRIESLSGLVEYRDGDWLLRDITLRGAGSDCNIAASYENDRWRGSVTGRSVNIDGLASFLEAAQNLGGEETETPAEGTAPNSPLLAEIDIDLNQLRYRRGSLGRFRTKFTAVEDQWQFANLSFRPYSGQVTGTVTVFIADGSPASFSIDLKVDGADARILDEIVFDEPNEFMGVVNGVVSLRAPWGETEEIMRGMNGTIDWTGEKGSFGKLGIATKLLAALRTTEIVALRKPAWRDEGLTYDTCSGKIVFENGIMRLQDAVLERPAYTMEAEGVLDFVQETTEVTVLVGLLESLNRLVDRIPIVRGAVDIALKPIQLRLAVVGSPYDPSVRVVPGGTLRNVPVETVRGITDAATGLLRRLRGKDREKEQ